jgi:hypothetical protein
VKRIAVAIFLSSFFLLRPFIMEFYGNLYPNDDFDYFAQSTSLAFGQFPSYKHEYLMDEPNGPERAAGPGIMAAPFVFAFSILDRINGSSIVEARTAQNVQRSWAVFGFIFSSAFYFCLGCMLLYWSARSLVGPSFAAWAVILMVICQGMPLYAYRRPVFSHVPEFFLQCVFVYLLIKNELSGGKLMQQWWSFVLLGIGAGLIALVRYNNILFTLVWPLLFIGRDRWQKKNWIPASRNILHAYFTAGVLILVFKLWPEASNHYTTYAGMEKELSVHAPWLEISQRFGHVLYGVDWGLIFTAPFLLLGALGLTLLDLPWKKKYILATLPLLVNFYIINVTGYQGSYYGYRYLIASAFPLLVLPLAFLLQWLARRIGSWWKLAATCIAILPIISMWCWEGNALVATTMSPVFFGKSDWTNATYQLDVWKTVLDLKALGGIIYLGGVQYCQYIFYAVTTGFKVSPPFDLKTLVQTILLYAMPFAMLWFFKDAGPTAASNKPSPDERSH